MSEVPVYQFNSIIAREPSKSIVNGLRATDRGAPDYLGVLAEHRSYIDTLRDAGCAVTLLPPLEEFPDSMFVEDPALVFSEGAIVLRPGAKTRQGEAFHIKSALQRKFDSVLTLPEGGYVDGGDILTMPDQVLIGLSGRTDIEGAKALQTCLGRLGKKSKIVTTPDGILHFKTACSLMNDDTVLMTARFASSEVLSGYRAIVTPETEEAAANALRINDLVLVGKDYPRTIDLLSREGLKVVPLDTREISKVDAGLSCMSLRWFDKRHV